MKKTLGELEYDIVNFNIFRILLYANFQSFYVCTRKWYLLEFNVESLQKSEKTEILYATSLGITLFILNEEYRQYSEKVGSAFEHLEGILMDSGISDWKDSTEKNFLLQPHSAWEKMEKRKTFSLEKLVLSYFGSLKSNPRYEMF